MKLVVERGILEECLVQSNTDHSTLQEWSPHPLSELVVGTLLIHEF